MANFSFAWDSDEPVFEGAEIDETPITFAFLGNCVFGTTLGLTAREDELCSPLAIGDKPGFILTESDGDGYIILPVPVAVNAPTTSVGIIPATVDFFASLTKLLREDDLI